MRLSLCITNLFLKQNDIMKKYSNIYIISLALTLIGMTSCNDFTDSLSDLNKNPNAYEEVIPEFLLQIHCSMGSHLILPMEQMGSILSLPRQCNTFLRIQR